mmetsp:Transcript_39002/g.44442  ORF Transcript_39002/g.44442 Transcript_39002/m.44442 type:complete len:290 (-) Transcript_39002:376-1245(-)
MCILTIAVNQHPIYKTVICINRDDAISWNCDENDDFDDFDDFGLSASEIVAAKEFSLINNFVGVNRSSALFAGYVPFNEGDDDIAPFHPDFRRSGLVNPLLSSKSKEKEVEASIVANRKKYPGFNLIVGSLAENSFKLVSSYSEEPCQKLSYEGGIAVITNGSALDRWPKGDYLRDTLRSTLRKNPTKLDAATLAGTVMMSKENSWKEGTGEGTLYDVAEEHKFDFHSPIFVTPRERDEDFMYATVSSTIILVKENGEVTYFERAYQHSSLDGSNIKFQDNSMTFNLKE